MLMAVAILVFSNQSEPDLSPSGERVFNQLGHTVAQRVVGLTDGTGRVILWYPNGAGLSEPLRTVLAGFRGGIEKAEAVSIVREVREHTPTEAVSAARLMALMEDEPQASLLVLFDILPALDHRHAPDWPPSHPRIFVVSLGDAIAEPIQENIFSHGRVAAVLMPRNTSPDASQPGTDAEIVDWAYMYVTPETSTLLTPGPSDPQVHETGDPAPVL
jgi:hypothetical protein